MDEIIIELEENYCCGGGHCGPLPGYDFKCPECQSSSFAFTGVPLVVGDTFQCTLCMKIFSVNELMPDSFFKISSVN